MKHKPKLGVDSEVYGTNWEEVVSSVRKKECYSDEEDLPELVISSKDAVEIALKSSLRGNDLATSYKDVVLIYAQKFSDLMDFEFEYHHDCEVLFFQGGEQVFSLLEVRYVVDNEVSSDAVWEYLEFGELLMDMYSVGLYWERWKLMEDGSIKLTLPMYFKMKWAETSEGKAFSEKEKAEAAEYIKNFQISVANFIKKLEDPSSFS